MPTPCLAGVLCASSSEWAPGLVLVRQMRESQTLTLTFVTQGGQRVRIHPAGGDDGVWGEKPGSPQQVTAGGRDGVCFL